MDGHELKMLRKKAALSQGQTARGADVDIRTWRRWELDEISIPAHIDAYIKQAVAEEAATAATGKRHDPLSVNGKPVPEDEAGRVAWALRTMDSYLATFESIPVKLGLNTPYAWAYDYWQAGVIRWPVIQFGPGGLTPCAPALHAALSRASKYGAAGNIARILVQLDDCPDDIKRSMSVPVTEPETE